MTILRTHYVSLDGEELERERNKREPLVVHLYAIMQDGGWWTIPELQRELRTRYHHNALDTSVSARIRDLRHGPWHRIVETQTRQGTEHTIEYSLLTPSSEKM